MKDLHRDGLASHTYFDNAHGMAAVKLMPNQYFVTYVDMLLTTVVGSCVAVCLCDPVAGVGGMNHFMLPGAERKPNRGLVASMSYGAWAMDVLVAALVAGGARRERLEAKVFGGAAVRGDAELGRIGEANAEFAFDYLGRRGIDLAVQDVGDRYPRRLHYYPATGLASVTRVKRNSTPLAERERNLAATLARAQASGELAFAPRARA